MAPRPSSIGSLRLLGAFLLCIALGYWMAGSQGAARPASPEMPAAIAPPTPEPLPEGAFPLDAAVRLAAQLRQVEPIHLSEDLGVLRDPDPRGYGRRLRAVPEYRQLLAWLTPEDGPRALEPAHREALAAIDEGFRSEGMLPPFEAFLQLEPAQEGGVLGELPGAHFLREAHSRVMAEDGLRVGPWGLAAGKAMVRVRELDREVRAILAEDIEGALGLRSRSKVALMGFLESDGQLLALFEERSARIRYSQLARKAVQAARLAMLLGARSLQEEPEVADRLACIWARTMVITSDVFPAELHDLELEELLGRRPRTPAEALFAIWVLREVGIGQEYMKGDLEAVYRRIPPLLELASQVPPKGARDRGSRERGMMARLMAVETSIRVRDDDALRDVIRGNRVQLRRRPAAFGWPALHKLTLHHRDQRHLDGTGLGEQEHVTLVKALEKMVETHQGHRNLPLMEAVLKDLRAPPRQD